MQVLVVGAGVIGLAVARTAALAGHDVTVAETTGGIANGVSSRNSEVVHGGLYYPTGSLRARHCVRGRRMLYEFCASHGVGFNKCGKLIVATNENELAKVETIRKQGEINGVEGMEMLGGNAARALEGELACIGALLSAETGIVDSHGYMNALWGELEDHGGMIAFETPVERMSYQGAALARAIRRQRAGHDRVRCRGQCRRARRAGARPPHRRLSGRQDPQARPRQGQLFQLRRTSRCFRG